MNVMGPGTSSVSIAGQMIGMLGFCGLLLKAYTDCHLSHFLQSRPENDDVLYNLTESHPARISCQGPTKPL